MGGKKKSGKKVRGQEKRPLSQKQKKWGISKKKDGQKIKGDEKTGPFKKNGDAQNSKNGKPRGGSKKIQIY